MARVLALVPDLLFGSRVQAALGGEGHEVELIGDEQRLTQRLADASAQPADALVVDLADDQLEGTRIVGALGRSGALATVRTLGFYAHVDAATRERALAAGFEMVVPRSRMAREGPALLERLLAGERAR